MAITSMLTHLIFKHWLRHLLVILVVITLFNFGLWQLDRLQQRREANQQITAGLNQPQVALTGKPVNAVEFDYRPVTVNGTYLNDESVLLRNQAFGGRPGMKLLVPLKIAGSDTAVIVDRGWIPIEESEPEQRSQYDVSGEVTVRGIARKQQPRPDNYFAPSDRVPADGGPLDLWFRVDVARIQNQVDVPLLPIFVQEMPGPSPDQSPPIRLELEPLSEGPHFSYAMQWFSFSAILVVTYGAFLWQEYQKEARN